MHMKNSQTVHTHNKSFFFFLIIERHIESIPSVILKNHHPCTQATAMNAHGRLHEVQSILMSWHFLFFALCVCVFVCILILNHTIETQHDLKSCLQRNWSALCDNCSFLCVTISANVKWLKCLSQHEGEILLQQPSSLVELCGILVIAELAKPCYRRKKKTKTNTYS